MYYRYRTGKSKTLVHKREKAAATREGLARSTPQGDVWIYRLVVGSLGGTVLISIVGAIILVAFGKEVPAVLVSLGSAAVGALAGLLAATPRTMNYP